MIKLEHFHATFDEEWKVIGKMRQDKRYKLSLVNQGTRSKICWFRFASVSSLEIHQCQLAPKQDVPYYILRVLRLLF